MERWNKMNIVFWSFFLRSHICSIKIVLGKRKKLTLQLKRKICKIINISLGNIFIHCSVKHISLNWIIHNPNHSNHDEDAPSPSRDHSKHGAGPSPNRLKSRSDYFKFIDYSHREFGLSVWIPYACIHCFAVICLTMIQILLNYSRQKSMSRRMGHRTRHRSSRYRNDHSTRKFELSQNSVCLNRIGYTICGVISNVENT